MAKSRSDRKDQEIELADVWPGPPIETDGAVGPIDRAMAFRSR